MRHTLPLVLLLLSGCAVEYGNGDLATDSRDVDGFTSVRNATLVDVSISVGAATDVEVRCDENLLKLILTEVEDGTLIVRTPNNTVVQPRTTCEVDVVMPTLVEVGASGSGDVEAYGELTDLERVQVTGSGDLFAEDVVAEFLELRATGSGAPHIRGVADYTSLVSTGSGGIDARDLSTLDAEITNTGSGDIAVTASGAVDVFISGSGNVLLFGEPEEIDRTVTGSGDLILD